MFNFHRMKNRLILIAFLISYYSVESWGQFTLTIEIQNLRSSNGQILLEVYDETHKSIQGVTGKIENNTCIIVIRELEEATYAFRYFHDENDDEELGTNWMGMPKEGFGFSNDAKGKFGPPAFKKWVFNLTGDQIMYCKPTYL